MAQSPYLDDGTSVAAAPAPTPAPRPNSVMPVATRNVPLTQPGVISTIAPGVRATLSGSGDDIASAIRNGDVSGAAGQTVRGALALVPAAADDLMSPALRLIGAASQPVRNAIATAATGTSGAASANPPAAAAPGPIATRAAQGANYEPFESGFAPTTVTAPAQAPASTGVAIAPGVIKNIADGRTTYTDGSAPPLPSGTVSAQNDAAAANLDARSRAESAAINARGDAPGTVTILAPSSQSAQGATGIDRSEPAFDTRGLSQREIARLSASLANTQSTNATSRANNTASNSTTERGQNISADTQREGQLLAALSQRQRLGLDASNAAVSNAHTHAQTQGLIQLEAAKTEYANALASKDADRIQRAEDTLRARQGKYEKTQNEQYAVVPIPGGVDPATGMQRGAGAIVVNKTDGTTKILSPEEAKGAPGATKYETGKVYRDAQGNMAKWDGSKFVPA